MKKSPDLEALQQSVDEDMEAMRAAVKKAQADALAAGVPICYMIDGVLHYELPSGEITRECPWPDGNSNTVQP